MKKGISVFLCVLLLLNLAGTALAEGGQTAAGPEPGQTENAPAGGDGLETKEDPPTTGGSEEDGGTGETGSGQGEEKPGPEEEKDPDPEGEGTSGDGTGSEPGANSEADTISEASMDGGIQPPADPESHFLITGPGAEDPGYEYSEKKLTIKKSNLTVSMDPSHPDVTDHTILVEPGVEELTIDGLHIRAQAGYPAMDLTSADQDVVLHIKGENSLTGGSGCAGIALSGSYSLIIEKAEDPASASGLLLAAGGENGAGIGGNSGAKGGPVEIGSGSVTVTGGAGAAGVGGGTGAAETGTVALNGGSLTAAGSPALGAAPDFDPAYLHLSYSGSPEAKNVAEWTGNPLPEASWIAFSWVEILPMKVDALTVSPDETTLTLTPPGPATAAFTAALHVTAGGESLAPLDVTKLAEWQVSSSASGIEAGALTVPYSEPANSLTVTAKATGSEGTAKVTILRPATAVYLDKKELTLTVGDTASLKATVDPENTTDLLEWTVAPAGIVSVDRAGGIKALAAGEATVTVTAGEVSASCKVTVKAPPQIYTVRFDANGGSCGTASMKTGSDGTLSSLPQASKQGQYFAGWYTGKTGGTRVSLATVYHADTTLYAHWSDVPVTGDANNPALWAALLGVSVLALCAVGAVLLIRKRRKK